jgi:hypothetical protein
MTIKGSVDRIILKFILMMPASRVMIYSRAVAAIPLYTMRLEDFF